MGRASGGQYRDVRWTWRRAMDSETGGGWMGGWEGLEGGELGWVGEWEGHSSLAQAYQSVAILALATISCGSSSAVYQFVGMPTYKWEPKTLRKRARELQKVKSVWTVADKWAARKLNEASKVSGTIRPS